MLQSQANASPTLAPLAYHVAVRDFFKQQEHELWQWFVSQRAGQEYAESVRFDLLKSTCRIERQDQPRLYELADEAAAALGLTGLPLTIYQAQHAGAAASDMNASLAFLPDEAHVVFHGVLVNHLSEPELKSVIGHELSHLLLWRAWDKEYLVTDQILSALTHDIHADAAHFATARLWTLSTEIFCDRGSLAVLGDCLPVVAGLIKTETGMQQVSAESYLRQADEIFSRGNVWTSQCSHPEAYVRARAIRLWADRGEQADAEIAEMLQGPLVLGQLDLLAQVQVKQATSQLISAMLAWPWMRSDVVLAHSRLYFPDFQPADADDAPIRSLLERADDSLRDYLCFVLLDLVTADRDLEHWPLAAACQLAEQFGLLERFGELARRELRLRKSQFERVVQQKDELLRQSPEGQTSA